MNNIMEDDSVSEPHKKNNLTTSIGRAIERSSWLDLFLFLILTLLLSSLYFYLMPLGDALGKKVNFYESLYFATVTFTTLGYGEFSPKGYGRLVAMLTVFNGMFLTALFISKIVSERQSAMLLLLHTSDCQRRLEKFSDNIDTLIADIQHALAISDKEKLGIAIVETISLHEALKNYIIFNSNQSVLAGGSNESALINLYLSIEKMQILCEAIHKAPLVSMDLNLSFRTLALVRRESKFVSIMYKKHLAAYNRKGYVMSIAGFFLTFLPLSVLEKQQQLPDFIKKLSMLDNKMTTRFNNLYLWGRSHINAMVNNEVLTAMPEGMPGRWPKDIHKRVAKECKISNKLAQTCIDSLLDTQLLPKFYTLPQR